MRIIFLAVMALSRLSLDAQTITAYVKDRAPVGPVDLSRGMAKAAELLCPASKRALTARLSYAFFEQITQERFQLANPVVQSFHVNGF